MTVTAVVDPESLGFDAGRVDAAVCGNRRAFVTLPAS
jgi:hypothetical protein